jgi:hypothetical protein
MLESEIQSRIDALRHLHYDSDRDRIRAVMNGGAEGIQAVLAWGSDNPGRDAADLGVDLPTANVMWSGLERLAQRVGRMPTLKTDMLPLKDTKTARKGAEKRARIVSGWDEMQNLEMQFPQMGRWLPGYGFTMQRIKEGMLGGEPYPVAELRDPYDVYPGWWGPGQQPSEVAVVRLVDPTFLKSMYPTQLEGKQRTTLPSPITRNRGGGWEGRGGSVEVVEYINPDGTYLYSPDFGTALSFIPNPLKSGPAFVMNKRFSFDKLKSQYTHVFGLMAMMSKLNLLGLIAAEDSSFRETNIFGDMNSTRYKKGRDAINFLEPGARVEKPTGDLLQQTWQAVNVLERQFRIVAGYDVQQDGSSPNSWATGAGMQELQGSADNNVREYQTALRFGTELVDRKRLEWDEATHPNRERRVFWYEGAAPYEETYIPSIDINKDYRTKRIYGAMATFDETSKILAGLQLLGARVLDRRTFQENLDGFENVSLINERIDQDQAKEALIAGLGMRFGEKDPAAGLALAEILKTPAKIDETLTKLFTPEKPDMSPEEQAMIQGAMAMGPGGPGGEIAPQPEPVQTILSQIEAQGGGAQTVART